MAAIANRLGVRITDGVIFPYTDLVSKQQDMRPWQGPMEKEWLADTREARSKRLKWLENDRGGVRQVVERGAPFSIATADKEELLEYVSNEFGEALDARLPVLVLRRQALALQSKQLDELERAERLRNEGESQPPPEALAGSEVQAAGAAEAAKVTPRGLGRRAA
jgi:hypothetical protein